GPAPARRAGGASQRGSAGPRLPGRVGGGDPRPAALPVRAAEVHALIFGARHSRTESGLALHNVEFDRAEIVERDGMRCTSLDRTVLDLTCALPAEAGLSAAD